MINVCDACVVASVCPRWAGHSLRGIIARWLAGDTEEVNMFTDGRQAALLLLVVVAVVTSIIVIKAHLPCT